MKDITQKEYTELKKSYKVLKRIYGFPKYNCKTHAFGCYQCAIKLFLNEFNNMLDDLKECYYLK